MGLYQVKPLKRTYQLRGMAITLRMRTTISLPGREPLTGEGGGGTYKRNVYGIGESLSQRTHPGYIWIDNL